MSTITVTNIKATGETASRAVSGVSAAWCRWDGTGTAAIVDSENTSALVDGGTGIYTLTWSSAMSNSNYCLVGMAGELTGGGNRGVGVRGTTQAPATGTCAFLAHNSNTGSAEDLDIVNISIHGDLA